MPDEARGGKAEKGGKSWLGLAKVGAVVAGAVAAVERRRRALAAAERAAIRSEILHSDGLHSDGLPGDGLRDRALRGDGPGVEEATIPAPRTPRTSFPPGQPLGRPATPAEAVPWSLRVAAESTWRLLLLGVALYVVFRVVDTLRLVAFAVLAALLISALLEPTVSWLRRHGVPRSLAAAGTFLSGVAGIGLVGWFVVWQVSANLDKVTGRVQDGVKSVRDWLVTGPLHLTQQQINDFANQISTAIGTNSEQITSAGFTGVTIAVELLTGVVLTAFTTFFLLYDGARIWSWVLRGLPQHSRYAMAGAGPKAWTTLTAYVRGTVAVAFIDALCIGIGIQLLGVPMALPLAVIIFLGAFVPLVGALVTGTIAVLIALVAVGPFTALMTLVVLVAVQQIEGHVLQPLILGRAVRVHPLGVVLGVAAGSIVGGIAGAIVAVPLIAVTNTVVGHLRRRNAAGLEVFEAIEAARAK
ncbi:AI-2E family transporter [Kitasatospora paracochleata]|uniref:PurR-regulated permease PerM n=1 Tax=Kitasatospora paracochleata TaxID=58354 RepID=A0ABT1IRU7_9ACTN|nr:AI-2E family transporter [Kitasatospora paracochleata]MCP2307346.1 putative PurR-regulated permease PerM [Kitasatospora paracochleata]